MYSQSFFFFFFEKGTHLTHYIASCFPPSAGILGMCYLSVHALLGMEPGLCMPGWYSISWAKFPVRRD